MDRHNSLGLNPDGSFHERDRKEQLRDIALKLATLGHDALSTEIDSEILPVARGLLSRLWEQGRLLDEHLCPPDQRVQNFLDGYLGSGDGVREGGIRLPSRTLVLDRHGLARTLSVPLHTGYVETPIISSYRLPNGVLHNPVKDRRTTQGVFHVAEGGLPIAADKIPVPKAVFGNLLQAALHPPAELMAVPLTLDLQQPAEVFVSLLLRPEVCPAVAGRSPRKTMEVRFVAPGGMVANLDFVESIFGNAGDPLLPENDAALDADHWTGHTGYVLLAPHLTGLTKRQLGLPRYEDATAQQRGSGMCFNDPEELYNGGQAFKITARTAEGVIVTIIADNYFGYCKKEVKTQISYAANLFGVAEEEHAGGAWAFPRYQLGETYHGTSDHEEARGHTFETMVASLGHRAQLQPEGYAVDKTYENIFYLPEDASIDLYAQKVTVPGRANGNNRFAEHTLRLSPDATYMFPSGYRVHMAKHSNAPSWALIGTTAEGLVCHKPSTVSGGGKSEISKSLSDAILFGPIYVRDIQDDLAAIDELINRDYSDRHVEAHRRDYAQRPSRPLLSPQRSLGSVIKMLTPSRAMFTPEYNAWLNAIPEHLRALLFIIKRFYSPEWGKDWRRHFTVDSVNGVPGHELKFGSRKLVGRYLRVGLAKDGSWSTHKLRQDFIPADKVQLEDDITVSTVVPTAAVAALLGHGRVASQAQAAGSVKLVSNCENRLFQRPDDAIHRGYDQQTEREMSQPGLFCSNYEPHTPQQIAQHCADAMALAEYTPPMREHLLRCASQDSGYGVISSQPRRVGGKPSRNPRYLQTRPDLLNPRGRYLAEVGTRVHRRLSPDAPVLAPVGALLMGRRNNPRESDSRIRPLAVYGPIHYQEAPELFMDFVCSLTGKSPSTTGAGSEGALTKGPFNALRATADLNNALVSHALTGLAGFSSAAGYIGDQHRVDHDISLLIPEIWCRLPDEARDPAFLIAEGHLERLEDFEHDGKRILASRLGYRVTAKFVHTYFGRVFDNPSRVFPMSMLKPETQDLEAYVDGINNISEAHQRVAKNYIDDGSIEEACPPLRALLYIMANGEFDGLDAHSPEFRTMFNKDSVLASDWYQRRLHTKQQRDIALWRRHVASLRDFLARKSHADEARRLGIAVRLQRAEETLERIEKGAYVDALYGTLGAN